MKNKIVKILKLWLPPIIWALLIFKLSSSSVPQVSRSYWPNFAVMKSAHVIFFGILSILLYRALNLQGLSKKKSAIFSVLITILYGISDEFHQMFTQSREARLRDVLFDGLGASIAIYCAYNFISKLPNKLKTFLVKLGIT